MTFRTRRFQSPAIFGAAAGGGGSNNIAYNAVSPLFFNNASSATAVITTTVNNCILIATLPANGAPAGSVTDTLGLTWTIVGPAVNNNELWYAVMPTAGTTTVTATWSGSNTIWLLVTAFSGINTTTPLDANAANPASTTTTTPLSFTTTSANTLLFADYAENSGSCTAGAGWTAVPGGDGGNFICMQYKLVTSAQSGLSSPLGTGTIKNGIGAAFVST